MGKFSPITNTNYQCLSGVLGGDVRSTPAYFNGTLYYAAVNDTLKALPFQNAQLNAVSVQTAGTYPYPGATPVVSANGTANAIVWTAFGAGRAALGAYNATNLIQLSLGVASGMSANKFAAPIIASARGYVGTTTGIAVFGIPNGISATRAFTPLQQWRNQFFNNPSNVGRRRRHGHPDGRWRAEPDEIRSGVESDHVCILRPDAAPEYSIGRWPKLCVPDRATNGLTDVIYNVEVSADLQNWQFGPPFTVTLTNVPSQLNVRDNTPVTAVPARFIRLQVTDP